MAKKTMIKAIKDGRFISETAIDLFKQLRIEPSRYWYAVKKNDGKRYACLVGALVIAEKGFAATCKNHIGLDDVQGSEAVGVSQDYYNGLDAGWSDLPYEFKLKTLASTEFKIGFFDGMLARDYVISVLGISDWDLDDWGRRISLT